MAENWDYAKLAHAAKRAGGPEKYLDIVKSHSVNKGRKQQALIDGSIILFSVVAYVGRRAYLHFKNKKITDQQAKEAEKELISKMNEALIQEQEIIEENSDADE